MLSAFPTSNLKSTLFEQSIPFGLAYDTCKKRLVEVYSRNLKLSQSVDMKVISQEIIKFATWDMFISICNFQGANFLLILF
jgi:hypothetical protein